MHKPPSKVFPITQFEHINNLSSSNSSVNINSVQWKWEQYSLIFKMQLLSPALFLNFVTLMYAVLLQNILVNHYHYQYHYLRHCHYHYQYPVLLCTTLANWANAAYKCGFCGRGALLTRKSSRFAGPLQCTDSLIHRGLFETDTLHA